MVVMIVIGAWVLLSVPVGLLVGAMAKGPKAAARRRPSAAAQAVMGTARSASPTARACSARGRIAALVEPTESF